MKLIPHHKVVILFATHYADNLILQQFYKLRDEVSEYADVVFLVHADMLEKDMLIPDDIVQYPFTLESLNLLGYESIEDTILPGSNHFAVLQFFKDYPGYDYYWNVEYDVAFSGNWQTFFGAFTSLNTDFISSHIQHYVEFSSWLWWDWFYLVTMSILKMNYIKSFNPIYRISNKGLTLLDRDLTAGNRGHHEVLIPTILSHHLCSIGDMGGRGSFVMPGFRDLFYTFSKNTDKWYDHSTMRYRPIYDDAQEMVIPDKLYHPIKW